MRRIQLLERVIPPAAEFVLNASVPTEKSDLRIRTRMIFCLIFGKLFPWSLPENHGASREIIKPHAPGASASFGWRWSHCWVFCFFVWCIRNEILFSLTLERSLSEMTPSLPSCRVVSCQMKVLSSVFFLFFACLAPAVAFGGMLGIATSGAMGTIEASRSLLWRTSHIPNLIIFHVSLERKFFFLSCVSSVSCWSG